VVGACAGLRGCTLNGREIPVAGSTCGTAFREATPTIAATLVYDVSAGLDEEFGPAMALPLRASSDTVSGVLVALRSQGREPFERSQLRLAASFADQAAIALKRAEDQRRLYEFEVLEDRDRIARELHDQVVQRLFMHGLRLQSTKARSRVPEVQRRLTEMIDDVQSIVAEIRTAIFDLHGGLQGTTGLRRKLGDIIAEITGDTGLQTTVRMAGPVGVVSPDLGEHAEAVVRETLSNVVRHAHASMVTVTVYVGDTLTVEVTDDGVGIPKTVARSGLHNLSERAAQAGGECTVENLDAGGARVCWSAPLH
jgi:two-component system, NarL family, sensor histidine kinase DevS